MKTTPALMVTAAAGLALATGSFAAAGALKDTSVVTRELPWDGGDRLILGAPAEVRYVQAAGPGRVAVTGPAHSIRNVRVKNGVLEDGALRTGARLNVVVYASGVTVFSAKGRDRLTIENYDQQTLDLHLTGAADVRASGRTGVVTLRAQGVGWTDLAQVKAEGADISQTGGRTAVVAPTAWAKLAGQGAVVLLGSPASVESRLTGRLVRSHAPPPAG